MTDAGPRQVSIPDPTHFVITADGTAALRHASQIGDDEVGHPLPVNWQDLGANAWDLDPETMTMVEAVERERARIWQVVKLERAVLTASGCEVPALGRVQTDPASLAAIEQRWGAAAADPENWSAVWTMADNRREPVDHAAMRAIKLAVDAHVDAIRRAADAIYAELHNNEVTTLAQLYAVPAILAERLA